jgi:predicted ABC-type sugar transport system permease subunit
MQAYGLARTLPQAIMARLLLGLFNGVVATCKTVGPPSSLPHLTIHCDRTTSYVASDDIRAPL